MRKLLYSILIIFNCLYGYSQSETQNPIIFFNTHSKENICLFDSPNGKIIYKVNNDIENEQFINIELIQKKENIFLVIVYQLGYEKRKGCIRKNSNLGIRVC